MEILDVAQVQSDIIDYSTIIFKVQAGETIDLDNSKLCQLFFETLIKGGGRKVIFDMRSLSYIDSAGIGTLIYATKLLRGKKGNIVFTNVSSEIKNIFNIINLQDFIKVCNLEVEAVEFFRYV